jgi:hypothetical protein
MGPLSMADRFPEGCRVIAFDRPPFGLTERPLQWPGGDAMSPYTSEVSPGSGSVPRAPYMPLGPLGTSRHVGTCVLHVPDVHVAHIYTLAVTLLYRVERGWRQGF